MGPHSTAPFIDLIITQCQIQYGAKLDEEFPHMMIYSLPTPFYIDKPIDHDEMKLAVKTGLRRLESTGVSFIVIPCNTVHTYFIDLRSSIKVKLLNIIEESIRELRGGKRIALVALGRPWSHEPTSNTLNAVTQRSFTQAPSKKRLGSVRKVQQKPLRRWSWYAGDEAITGSFGEDAHHDQEAR